MASRERVLAIAVIVAASTITYWPGSSDATPPGHDPPAPVALKSRKLQAPADPQAAASELADIAARGTRHVIVQLEEVPDPEAREELERRGLKLLDYLGNRGWYASVAATADEVELQDTGLAGAWAIEPSDRLSPALRRGAVPAHARRPDGTVAVSVITFAGTNLPALRDEIEGLGGRVTSERPEFDMLFVRINPGLVNRLAEIDAIQWIEPVAPTPEPEMDRARLFLNTEVLHSTAYNLSGLDVDVSVHDSGHAFRHNDYDDRWTQGDTQTLSVIQHASMTAGTIAGDGGGNAAFRGMAPRARIVTYSFSDPESAESNNYGDIADALSRGVEIANNSWGYNGCSAPLGLPYGDYTSQARVYDLQVRGRNSSDQAIGNPMTVVFSAGNERDGFADGNNLNNTSCITNVVAPFANYGTINQPKPAKNIIAVGAVDSATSRMSTFSSWGPTSDGRLKPEIVAPGVHNGRNVADVSDIDIGPPNMCFGEPPGNGNQQCYRAPSDTNTNSSNTDWDDRYAWFSQTSAAAAMVSGNAALFIREFRNQNAGATPLPSTVKAYLVHTARDIDNFTSWYNKGPDYASGYGVLDARAAIDQMRLRLFEENTIDHGQSKAVRIEVPAGATSVKITLAWDDPPAAPATTGSALINDLDLVVTDPKGTRRYPWTLNPFSPSADAVRTAEDHRNNLEMVFVDGDVPAGVWTIRVRGSSVTQGSQKYSLVFSHPKAVSNVDLVVTSLSAPSVVAPGQLITVNDTTKNQGSSAAEASHTAYYWSVNKTLEPTDTLLGSRAVPALAAGASSSSGVLVGNVSVPDKVANGTYYILAVADAADVVFESLETNNVRSKQVKVGPDLVVSKLTGPSKAAPGQTVTVTDTVKNQGSTTAASSFTRFYWSTNSTFGTGDVLLGERNVSSLAAGVGNVGAGTALTIPAGAANGTYYIVAVADGRGTVSETTETNNGRGLKVGINPDLSITAFTAPTSAARGSTILVSDTTSNIGSVAAGASTTRFYLSTNSSFDSATDTLLTSRAVGALSAGASSSGNAAVTIPSSGGAGTFYLIAVADGDKVLAELSETNNTKAKSIVLSAAL